LFYPKSILDLDDKDACISGQWQAGGEGPLFAAGAAIAAMETSPGDENINDDVK
jgi:hypothetical protein